MKSIIARMMVLVLILVMGVPGGLGENNLSAIEQQWLAVMKEGWLNGYTDAWIQDMLQISDALVQASDSDWLAYTLAGDAYIEAKYYYFGISCSDQYGEISNRYYEEASKLIQTTTLDDILNRNSSDLFKGYACSLYAMKQEPDEAMRINRIAAELLSGDAMQILPYQNLLMVYFGVQPSPYSPDLYVYYGAVEGKLYQYAKNQETCEQLIRCARSVLPLGRDPSFREATCYYGTCASAFLCYSAYYENNRAKFLSYMKVSDEFLENYRELDECLPDWGSALPVVEMYNAHLHFLYAKMIHDDSEFESSYERLKQILHTLGSGQMDIFRVLPREVATIAHNVDSLHTD